MEHRRENSKKNFSRSPTPAESNLYEIGTKVMDYPSPLTKLKVMPYAFTHDRSAYSLIESL